MEANGRLQGSNNKRLWPECLALLQTILGFEGWQTAGLNAL